MIQSRNSLFLANVCCTTESSLVNSDLMQENNNKKTTGYYIRMTLAGIIVLATFTMGLWLPFLGIN